MDRRREVDKDGAVMTEKENENLERLRKVSDNLIDVDGELLLLRGILENVPVAIIGADEWGIVNFFNPEAERIFQRKTEDVMWRPLSELMPERYRAAHEAGLKRVAEARESKLSGQVLKVHGLRPDGTEFPVEVHLKMHKRDGHLYFTAKVREGN